MITDAQENVEVDVDLDATLKCAFPSCDLDAVWRYRATCNNGHIFAELVCPEHKIVVEAAFSVRRTLHDECGATLINLVWEKA